MIKQSFEKIFVHEWGKVALAAIILASALGAGMLPIFTGKAVYEDDVTHYYLPAFKWYSESIKADESVALTPEVFSGFPLALSQVGGFYDPLNRLIFGTLPFPESYNVRIFLNYLLGGVFMFLFARSLRLGFIASSVAMFAFATAQYIIPGANILRSSSFFIMPALFFSIHELYLCTLERRLLKAWVYVLLGAAVITASFLSGYTQLNIYGLIAALMFAVYLLYRTFSIRFLFDVSVLFIIGIAPIVPYVASVLEFVPATYRAGGLDWQSASQSAGGMSYIQNLTTNLVIPPLHGSTLQSLYLGVVGVFFFFLSLFFVRRSPPVLFFSGLLLFSLLSAFPYPLFYLMHQLPVLEFFRFPPHWFFVSSFAMSVLAGLGVEQLRTSVEKFARLRRKLNTRTVGAGIIFMCMLNLALPIQLAIAQYSIPLNVLLEEPWVVTQIRKLNQAAQQFRTYQLYSGDVQWFVFARDASPTALQKYDFNREYTQTHLTPLLWNIESIRGFDNLVPRRYAQVLAFLERERAEDALNEQEVFQLPEGTFSLLGMMNVKYIWTVPPLSPEHNADVELIGSAVSQFSGNSIPFHLYQNRRFLPRFYVPPTVVVLDESEHTFSTIIEKPNDFTRRAFIECSTCEKGEFTQTQATVTLVESENNRLSFTSNAPDAYWLVVSNALVPGWKVYIDGVETNLSYANYIYQGILIPAGKHAVVLEYPAPYSVLLP